MSGGLYSRIKIWGPTDTVTQADLNAEFDNVLNNFTPQEMASYSATVGQMQIQTNPGAVGSESLAVALSGEIERLRFQIAAITGNTYWYAAPGASISQLVSALGTATLANKISSGLTNGVTGSSQPAFLVASGSTNTVTLQGASTPFVYSVAGATYTISTNVSITSLTTAPSTNNTCVVNDPSVDNSTRTQLLGENGSTITVATMGSSVSALVGQIACFKTAGTEYFIGRVESSTTITQCMRGYFFNSSSAAITRSTINNGDTLTLMKLTWIYVTTAGGIVPVYTNPRVSGTAPSSPATGDYWFNTVNNYWEVYGGTSWTQANATLIGVCFQNTTATIGTRSFDFFQAYSAANTCELFTESTTEVRSRYTDSQVSVYGNSFNFHKDFIRWDTGTNMDSGVTFSASTFYYLYLNTQGNTIISNVAPYDRRGDLQGYYHPYNTYRCLGQVYSNASTAFAEVDSFYRSDTTTTVSAITAAVANFPLPFSVMVTEMVITCNASAGAFTQVLPPPYQWKGKTFTYIKTDSSLNQVKLQAWGSLALSTTGTASYGANTITTMGSTTGITTGGGYLVSGPGMSPGNTVTTVGSLNVTNAQNAFLTTAGKTFTFANSTGINGVFTTNLSTQYESVTLFSDGTNVMIMARNIPSYWQGAGPTTITGTTTNPTKGTMTTDASYWRRDGANMQVRVELNQSVGGNAGSGDYLFAIPNSGSLTIDTTCVTLSASVGSSAFLNLVGTTNCSLVGTSTGPGGIGVFSTTQVRAAFKDSATATYATLGSGVLALSNGLLIYSFNYSVPITGWAGL